MITERYWVLYVAVLLALILLVLGIILVCNTTHFLSWLRQKNADVRSSIFKDLGIENNFYFPTVSTKWILTSIVWFMKLWGAISVICSFVIFNVVSQIGIQNIVIIVIFWIDILYGLCIIFFTRRFIERILGASIKANYYITKGIFQQKKDEMKNNPRILPSKTIIWGFRFSGLAAFTISAVLFFVFQNRF